MADAPGTMHDDADSNRRLANVELSDEDVLLMAEASGDATFSIDWPKGVARTSSTWEAGVVILRVVAVA